VHPAQSASEKALTLMEEDCRIESSMPRVCFKNRWSLNEPRSEREGIGKPY
jgi:hypothetical protein